MSEIRFELLKLVHHQGLEPAVVVERVRVYEQFLTELQKNEQYKPKTAATKFQRVALP